MTDKEFEEQALMFFIERSKYYDGTRLIDIEADALIYVIILLVVVNVILICLYRRCSNKEIKDDMQL